MPNYVLLSITSIPSIARLLLKIGFVNWMQNFHCWKPLQLLLLLINSNQGMWWGHCATFSFWWNCQWNFLLACHGPWQFGVSSIIESDPGHDEQEGQKWKGTFFFLLIHMYTLDILFLSNHNINKSSCHLCFWASDPLIERFY